MGSEPPLIEPKDYIKGSPAASKTRHATPASWRWIVRITGWTFVISICMSLISSTAIPRMNIVFAILVLLCFIALGVFFDILGISVATASSKPFHSMAARRVPGAAHALRLLKNAEKTSSFCNDVVGDIAGIISGATASVIVTRIALDGSLTNIILQVIFSGVVSAVTVGSKACGKTLSMKYNVAVVTRMGLALYHWDSFKKCFTKSSKRVKK